VFDEEHTNFIPDKFPDVFIDLKQDCMFDEEYTNFIPDKIPDEFIDLYKLLKLNIDMSCKEIEEIFYSQEKNIILLNDIKKYIEYKILLNINTKKIYDNYYLDYYIENWDKISIDFSDGYISDKKNSNEILSQFNYVYSKLYNSDTTISEKKLNSENITSLIDVYNKKCEDFIIKDEKKDKTDEELAKIHIEMSKRLCGLSNPDENINDEFYKYIKKYNYQADSIKLNNELENCKASRNKFLQDLKLFDNSSEIIKIIETYKEHKIIPSELLDYYRYNKNIKSNIESNNFIFSSKIYSDDNMIIDALNIKLDCFNIEDFNLWRIIVSPV
jgi:hypothetical protein